MAPITTTNDFQQSYENMNTSFVSSMKTSYQSGAQYNQQQTSQDLEPTQSASSIKTLVKNESNSPTADMHPKSPSSLKDAHSQRNSRKSNHIMNQSLNDKSEQSLATYRSSKHSSKKRTSAAADAYITPPFTPSGSHSRNISTSRLSSQMSAFNNNEQFTQGSSNKSSHINQRSINTFPSSSSMKHTVQFQNSSIYNSQTPSSNQNNTLYTVSYPTGTSERTSLTTTTYDPTSITPFGLSNRNEASFQLQSSLPVSSSNSVSNNNMFFPLNTTSSSNNTSSNNNMLVPSSRNTQFGTSFDMTPSSMFQQNSNFMPNNPNNPNSKDFSYMLFNIKVFRTPKEQS